MGVMKKGVYDESNVHGLSFHVVEIDSDSKTENLDGFDKESYISAVEEAKDVGYKEGYIEGYNSGYAEGKSIFEEERKDLYNKIELDKQNFKSLLERESIEYISNFNKSISSLLSKSMNKLFLNAVSNDFIMINYFKNLVEELLDKYESFTIYINSKTVDLFTDVITQNEINVCIDNKLQDLDIVVKSSIETLEFFINDEFGKIMDLFN